METVTTTTKKVPRKPKVKLDFNSLRKDIFDNNNMES